jgi:hypothetical protein
VLTTQQLRETETSLNRTIIEKVASLRELLEQRLDGMDRATVLLAEQISGIDPELTRGREMLRREAQENSVHLRELLESRLDGMDTAIELLASNLDKSPTDIEKAVGQLQQLITERLDAMDKATELLAATVGRVPSDTDKQVNALRELLGARIDGMDRATKLLAETVDHIPTDVDRAVGSATDLIQSQLRSVQDVANEKFLAIDGTFASNALALTAALAAQKEAAAEQNKSNTLAITKSEQATKETISANAAQTAAGMNSITANINDLKERLVRMEAGGISRTEQRGEQLGNDTYSQMERMIAENRVRAAATIAISVLAVLVSIVVAIVLVVHH